MSKWLLIGLVMALLCTPVLAANVTTITKLFENKNILIGAFDVNCSAISGTAVDLCTITSGGGSGTNYWQVSGSWMWPNITAGGQNNINVTTLNATTIYQNGVQITGDNTSWNESHANTLYYSISNPFNYINSSNNYWYTSGSWMFPNISAGGQNNINVSTLNASNINTYDMSVNGHSVMNTMNVSGNSNFEANLTIDGGIVRIRLPD